ncbi:MAG: hypothetical protein OXH69_05950 [Acidobacteria bacterium]|nr:hypothetical protein [Acidobacteriota bacterium]
MWLVPAWAPNLHPLIVHFPIALLAAAGAVDLADLLLRGRGPVRNAATWLYVAGAATAVAAYFSGVEAGRTAALTPAGAELAATHADWAFRATWLFAFFASVRLAMSYAIRPGGWLVATSLVIAAVGLAALVQTVRHGSRLVFEHGVGVRAVAAAGAAAAERSAAAGSATVAAPATAARAEAEPEPAAAPASEAAPVTGTAGR